MPSPVRTAAQAAEKTAHESWGSLNWLANKDLLSCAALTLGRVVIKAGQKNPRHRHNTCEELLYLLSGKLEHTLGDQTVTLNPGDTLRIPAGVFHNATSTGKEDADMIVAYSTATRDFELEKKNP